MKKLLKIKANEPAKINECCITSDNASMLIDAIYRDILFSIQIGIDEKEKFSSIRMNLSEQSDSTTFYRDKIISLSKNWRGCGTDNEEFFLSTDQEGTTILLVDVSVNLEKETQEHQDGATAHAAKNCILIAKDAINSLFENNCIEIKINEPTGINEILENHNKWLNSGGEFGKMADFKNDYDNIDKIADRCYSNIDLRAINFSGLTISNCNFIHCNLDDADFSAANLSNCSFEQCQMRNVKIRYSTVTKTYISCCNLESSLISNVKFLDTGISGCEFLSADIFSTCFKDCRIIDLDFRDTNIKNCEFDDSNLYDVLFNDEYK